MTAIKPSTKPRPYCGTSSLIPGSLSVGGDRQIDVTISVDSVRPYKRGKTTYEGKDKALIADWLPEQYGMRGKPVGDMACPADLCHALMAATWLEWEIIEGKEVLDLPPTELPEGAIN